MKVPVEADIEGYDLIGDVHGCYDMLVRLLLKMGYQCENGVYAHPCRKVIFLGDILDRGRGIFDTVRLVRAMVDSGNAWLVLGNHEVNAVLFAANAFLGGKLRARPIRPLLQTLKQFRDHQEEWRDTIEWLRGMPLALEFPEFRAVHACWDQNMIARLNSLNPSSNLADDAFLLSVLFREGEAHRILDRLLKGVNLRLPDGYSIRGGDGVERSRFRAIFWEAHPTTYGDLLFVPDRVAPELRDLAFPEQERSLLTYYSKHEKPLFVGHYWRRGAFSLFAPNIVCLDYSAVRGGRLVAYRTERGVAGLEVGRMVSVGASSELSAL
ncbi:Serine/threonine protein phosphatase [gamma proteobacterium HdN1]|nr:Serine/threonine protein phosphatase [gamma proteobacterium HdN1]